MKIELEIPDELIDPHQNLFLFSGMNHIAFKRREKEWMVKTQGCSMCGECCCESHAPNLPMKDGWCMQLEDHPTEKEKRWCNLGILRPFGCAIGIPKFEPECTLKWEKANDVSNNNQG